MAIGLKIDPEQRIRILAEICDRNRPGMLVHHEPDKPTVRARTRFLQLTDDTLYIDHPTAAARSLIVRPGKRVTVYFTWNDQRLAFGTRVTGRGKWRDGALETLTLQLRVPEKIVKSQRRECYRLSLVHIPDATIQFEVEDDSIAPWGGWLVDLSETGGSVIVKKNQAPKVKLKDEFVAAFILPGFEFPFIVPCEVRWRNDMKEGDRFKIGIQWQLDESTVENRQLQKDLATFIANEQTVALRRLRDKNN